MGLSSLQEILKWQWDDADDTAKVLKDLDKNGVCLDWQKFLYAAALTIASCVGCEDQRSRVPGLLGSQEERAQRHGL